MKESIDDVKRRLNQINRDVDRYNQLIDAGLYDVDAVLEYVEGEFTGREHFLNHTRDIAAEMADIIDRTHIDTVGVDMAEAENLIDKERLTEARVAEAGLEYSEEVGYVVSEELPSQEFSLGYIYRRYISDTEEVNQRFEEVTNSEPSSDSVGIGSQE